MTARKPSTQASNTDRLAALETDYRHLGREIGGLREDFASFAREVRNELHSRSRTQWSPIIAGVAVIVSVLGGLITLGGRGITSDLSRHDTSIDRIQSHIDTIRADRFTDADGRELWRAIATLSDEDFDRPEAERMRDELVGIMDTRDEAHRREVELAVAALREAVRGLDARLDREERRNARED